MPLKCPIPETRLFSRLQLRHFSYVQVGGIETVVDRIGSISFISALPEQQRHEVLNEVRNLVVESHPDTNGQYEIKLPYRTDFFWCGKI